MRDFVRKFGRLEYYAGHVHVESAMAGNTYRVRLRRPHFPDWPLEVHEVVVRHGAKPVIEELFPKKVADQMRRPFVDVDDPTRRPCYPADFFQNPVWERFNAEDRLGYAIANASRAGERYLLRGTASAVSVEEGEGTPCYRVHLKEGNEKPSGHRVASFDVHFEVPSKAAKASKQSTVAPTHTRRSLPPTYPGSGLREAPGGLVRGTVGCFVAAQDGSPALFTSSLSISRLALGHPMYVEYDHVATLAKLQPPRVSAPGATLSADTAVLNEIEGAIAVLEKDVKWSHRFGRAHPLLPAIRAIAHPRLGQEVFKVGWRSGLTRGNVGTLSASQGFATAAGTVWFRNLICILGEGGGLFSKPGDGGAMVLTGDGDILGHIVGGSAGMTFVCPAVLTFEALGCRLLVR
jgi:hypothetical protein